MANAGAARPNRAQVRRSRRGARRVCATGVLERRSKPPFRTAGTRQQDPNALKFLRPVFGNQALGEITAEAIEDYLAQRLECGRRVHTKFRHSGEGQGEARHAAPGVPHPLSYAERRAKAEAVIGQSLTRRQVSGLGCEILVIHIADSKTVNGIGDMPMTPLAREAFARQMAEAEDSEYMFPTPKLHRLHGLPWFINSGHLLPLTADGAGADFTHI